MSTKEYVRKRERDYVQSLRRSAIAIYGDKCQICSINLIDFLTLDHINGNGGKQISKFKSRRAYYAWIIKNKPEYFRILCQNHNMITHAEKMNYKHLDLSEVSLNNRKNKLTVFEHYSNGAIRCACCKFDVLFALAIDHIDGGGKRHMRDLKVEGGCKFYNWLKRNNYPSGYQVLCFNCNFSKYVNNGECIHQLILNN